MGTCNSCTKPVDDIKVGKKERQGREGKISKLNIHAATGLHPGDTPYPTGSRQGTPPNKSRQGTPSRRPSTSDSSGRRSPTPNNLNPGGLHLLLSAIDPDSIRKATDSNFELDLYDTCPTPYHEMIKDDIPTVEEESNLMRLEFLTATVDYRNVKHQMDELITGPEELHIAAGLKGILGVCPDSDEEIFNATYVYRSEFQLHKKCDKKIAFYLRAPKGLHLRIICVSYHGHDYVASANSLLKYENTILDIPAGMLEEKLKCFIPPGGHTMDIPFLFTYVLESNVFHKTCGIYEDFLIPKFSSLPELKEEIGIDTQKELKKDQKQKEQTNIELLFKESEYIGTS